MNAAPSSAAFANGLSSGYELRVTMFGFGYDFVLVVFLVSVSVSVSTFGCVFGFSFGSVCCHVACCSLLAFVYGSLYFPFGYVFCPRYVGIMLLEGGLTGNSYGLQRVSHLQWSGAFK